MVSDYCPTGSAGLVSLSPAIATGDFRGPERASGILTLPGLPRSAATFARTSGWGTRLKRYRRAEEHMGRAMSQTEKEKHGVGLLPDPVLLLGPAKEFLRMFAD